MAGSRKFLRLVNEKKYDEALSIARQQVEDGALVIDVNMDDGLLDAKAEMTTFLNLIMSEQEYMDFRSKYLDIAIGHTGDKQKGTPDATQTEIEHENIDNVDFCLELLHSDVINVAYILALIADLNPDSEDYRQKRQQIIDNLALAVNLRRNILHKLLI